MKAKLILLHVCFFLFLIFVQAQEKVEVSVSQKEMSEGTQTAFVVFIPESNPKMVENQWKSFINDRSFFEFATTGTAQTMEKAFIGISNIFSKEKKTFNKNSLKVEKKRDELIVKDVIHEEVTQDHIDVYARITGTVNGTYLSSFFKYSDSIFINETNVTEDALNSIKYYLREFGVETYRKVVEGQISDEEKELRNLNLELKGLENKNRNMVNSISRKETNIDEFYDDIDLIELDINRVVDKIRIAKDSLNTYDRKSVEYELIKENIKELGMERKKNLKKIKSLKNKIKREQSKIRNINADILENEREQELQAEIIKKQELVIEDFENKLSNIK